MLFSLALLLGWFGQTPSETSAPAESVSMRIEVERVLGPARQQGERPTCSLFAINALASFEAARADDSVSEPFSEEFLIWATRAAASKLEEGAMFDQAIAGLDGYGALAVSALPYRGEPANEAAEEAQPPRRLQRKARTWTGRWVPNWIRRWNVRTRFDAAAAEQLRQSLRQGAPVAVGMRWPRLQQGGDVFRVLPAEEVFDGHSVLIIGYAFDSEVPGGGWFEFRNSFGPAWGDAGYGRVSFAYAEAYFNDVVGLQCAAPETWVPDQSFEVEDLQTQSPARSPTEVLTTVRQDMSAWGAGLWSGKEQLFVPASQVGSTLELIVQVASKGRYRVALLATAAPDFGILDISLAGSTARRIDLYAGRVATTGRVSLGEFELARGEQVLHVQVVGKSPASSGYKFGLDRLDLIRIAD